MLASAMIQELKDHGFDGISDATLLEFINDAYFGFCGREPWPFLEKTAPLTVSTTTGAITSPTDMRAIISIVDTTNGGVLTPQRRDVITNVFPKELTKAGNALYYYSVGDTFYLYPIPTGVSYTADYLQRPAALSTGDSPIFDANFHRYLVLGAARRCAVLTDDTELATDYRNQEEDYYQNMRNVLWRKQYDEPETILDVDGTDYFYWDAY